MVDWKLHPRSQEKAPNNNIEAVSIIVGLVGLLAPFVIGTWFPLPLGGMWANFAVFIMCYWKHEAVKWQKFIATKGQSASGFLSYALLIASCCRYRSNIS